MDIFLTYSFMFFTGSITGWWLELFFRKFFSKKNPEHKWLNPGFLNGPYLPLYGFGLCALYTMSYFENFISIENELIQKIVLFALMAAAMTIIEYIAGIIFIKGMKTKLWDYSEEKWNIQGIICPKFSFFWAVLSAVYYFLIHPSVQEGISWLFENLAFSFFIGMFFGIFLIDVGASLNILVTIRKFAADNDIIVRYERLKAEIHSRTNTNEKIKNFLLQFRSDRNIYDSLQEHMQNLKNEFNSRLKK